MLLFFRKQRLVSWHWELKAAAQLEPKPFLTPAVFVLLQMEFTAAPLPAAANTLSFRPELKFASRQNHISETENGGEIWINKFQIFCLSFNVITAVNTAPQDLDFRQNLIIKKIKYISAAVH